MKTKSFENHQSFFENHQNFFENHQKLFSKEHLNRQEFNFVVINHYVDGSNYIGPHKNDEKDLVEGSTILSLSLGVERDFRITKEKNVLGKPFDRYISLPSGCILTMEGNMQQHHYNHSLPKRLRCKDSRINLTFRTIIQQQ